MLRQQSDSGPSLIPAAPKSGGCSPGFLAVPKRSSGAGFSMKPDRPAVRLRTIAPMGAEVSVSIKQVRLNSSVLCVLAATTGLVNNWLLRSYGLNMAQRTIVALSWLPLLLFLVLICVFQQMALQRK